MSQIKEAAIKRLLQRGCYKEAAIKYPMKVKFKGVLTRRNKTSYTESMQTVCFIIYYNITPIVRM